MKRKMMTMILVGSLLCSSLAPVDLKKAEALSANKTVTVTLDKASPKKHIEILTNAKQPSGTSRKAWDAFYKKAGLQIKVRIVDMKGKPKKGKIDTFYAESEGGKGSLLLGYAAKKFKRGIIYDDSNEIFHAGRTYIDLSLDDIKGVSKITYQFTFTNSAGKKGIKSVKVKKGYFKSQLFLP